MQEKPGDSKMCNVTVLFKINWEEGGQWVRGRNFRNTGKVNKRACRSLAVVRGWY